MALQFSMAVRNARLDAIETAIGADAVLKMFSGAPPADVSQPDSGTVIATMDLPADYMLDASNAQKPKSGIWEDTEADNAGTLGHFRIYASGGTVPHIQGTITATSGGGDLEVQNTVVEAGQPIEITAYQINEPNG